MMPLIARSAASLLLLMAVIANSAAVLLLMVPLITNSTAFMLLLSHHIADAVAFLLLLAVHLLRASSTYPMGGRAVPPVRSRNSGMPCGSVFGRCSALSSENQNSGDPQLGPYPRGHTCGLERGHRLLFRFHERGTVDVEVT